MSPLTHTIAHEYLITYRTLEVFTLKKSRDQDMTGFEAYFFILKGQVGLSLKLRQDLRLQLPALWVCCSSVEQNTGTGTALLGIDCVTFGNLLSISVPEIPLLQNGGNNDVYLLLAFLKVLHVMLLEQCQAQSKL